MVVGFGVPRNRGAPLGTVLPFLELAIAVALLPTGTARWAAAAAFVLLVAFSVAIAVNLARGRRPECNCFGAVHSAPIGAATLARNAALALVAAWVAVAGPGASAVGWLGRLPTAALPP